MGSRKNRLCRKWHIVRLAKISENAILRLMAACIVSFVDLDGIRHSVEVEAEGLYEETKYGPADGIGVDDGPEVGAVDGIAQKYGSARRFRIPGSGAFRAMLSWFPETEMPEIELALPALKS